MRQQSGLGVHEDQAQDQKAEYTELEGKPSGAEICITGAEQKTQEELGSRVTNGDGLPAIAATAAQEQPADYGNVVKPADARATSRTVGRRPGDGLLTRNAADADVQEAPEHQAHKEKRAFEEKIQAALENILSRARAGGSATIRPRV